MIRLNHGGELPEKFKCAGHEITVIIKDRTPKNNYGYFCDVTNEIILARKIDVEGEGDVLLSDQQIKNTFYHELIHCFQFYYDNSYSESQAQVYANFLYEFLDSSSLPF